jgi:hypothetical protein
MSHVLQQPPWRGEDVPGAAGQTSPPKSTPPVDSSPPHIIHLHHSRPAMREGEGERGRDPWQLVLLLACDREVEETTSGQGGNKMEAIQATDSAEEVLVVCVVLEFYVVRVGVHFNAR